MSAHMWTLVNEHSTTKGVHLLLMLQLADGAHDDGRFVMCGYEDLADKCRVTLDEVHQLIKELEATGELRREPDEPYLSPLYRIVIRRSKA